MPRFFLADPRALPPDAVLLDTRPAADHWAGHLPGARHLDASLLALPRTDAVGIGRFQALLGFALSSLGVRADRPVVVYGAAAEVNVARVAWALAYAGVERVGLVDGGLKASAGIGLTTEAPSVTPTRFVLAPVASLLATADEVAAAGAGVALVDVRERDEFLGLRSNASRDGRIPGALHWDTGAEVDAQGRLRPVPALAALGAPSPRRILYCGGGGRAARSFVALQLTGAQDAAVYPGSWNEWGNQDRPIASGEPA